MGILSLTNINTLAYINFSINLISIFVDSYQGESPSSLLYTKKQTYKLSNLATGLPSPKHILTFMYNGQASPLARKRGPL